MEGGVLKALGEPRGGGVAKRAKPGWDRSGKSLRQKD